MSKPSEDLQARPGEAERYPARIQAAELSPDGRHVILTYEITRAGQAELLELEVPVGEVNWPTLLLSTLRGGRNPQNIQ